MFGALLGGTPEFVRQMHPFRMRRMTRSLGNLSRFTMVYQVASASDMTGAVLVQGAAKALAGGEWQLLWAPERHFVPRI